MSGIENQYYIIPTDLGRTMIAEGIASGRDINLSLVAVGDAEYAPTADQTELKAERARIKINSLGRVQDNPGWLRIEAILPPDMGGFHIHEIGILTAGGELFAIGKMDGSYKPHYSAGMSKEVALEIILEVGTQANVNMVLDPYVVIATRQWVMEYIGWTPWGVAINACRASTTAVKQALRIHKLQTA